MRVGDQALALSSPLGEVKRVGRRRRLHVMPGGLVLPKDGSSTAEAYARGLFPPCSRTNFEVTN